MGTMRRAVLIAAVALVAGCAGAAPSHDIVSSWGQGATGAGETPVTVRGTGIMTSATFRLMGSEYAVTWEARDTGTDRVGCYHAAGLYDGAGNHVGDLGTANVDGGSSASGTTYLHNLQRGDHYVDASSGCDWTITLTPSR